LLCHFILVPPFKLAGPRWGQEAEYRLMSATGAADATQAYPQDEQGNYSRYMHFGISAFAAFPICY
jgi:hypothetical protein